MIDHEAKTVTVDADQLTRMRPKDLVAAEDASGMELGDLIGGLTHEKMTGRALWAVAFLMLRRELPDVSWDEAGGWDVVLEAPPAEPTADPTLPPADGSEPPT